MRRLVGIVTGICALYLTVGAVEAQCSNHFRGALFESGAAMMPHHSNSHHEVPVSHSEQSTPCTSAAIPCCVAMTSCGTTIALDATVLPTAFPVAAQIVPPSLFTQPPSRLAAPEPPPPKA